MSTLRWILLAAGAVLVVGLWWWERRRGAVRLQDADVRPMDRFEPRLGSEPVAEPARLELPTLRAVPEERTVPRGDPPLVTIEGLPENADDVVLGTVRPEPAPRLQQATPGAPPEPPPARPGRATGPEATAARPVTGTPLPRRPKTLGSGRDESPRERGEPPSMHQKLVALRLVARGAEPIAGAALRAALDNEGLTFGRYSIYHRQRADGRAIYSVASLVEPGSFEVAHIDAQRFPGVSLFAVFPGPLPAPEAFDEMLAAARRLAERLGGMLQDERGGSLTPQGALGLREELVHFEHLVSVSRDRTSA